MIERVSSSSRSAAGSIDPVKRVFTRLCRSAKTPLAAAISKVASDDLEISKLSVNISDYHDSSTFRVDYLLVSYLSKYKGLNTGIDTKAVALSGFAAAEAICKTVNGRFRARKTSIVDPILYRAQQLVSKCLGVFDHSLLSGRERWGPGASTDLPRRRAYLDSKLAELPISVTAECLPLLKAVIQSDLRWSEIVLGYLPEGAFSLLDVSFLKVAGSNIVTVDKNAKTDRTIAIEPRGNMFLQKAVGNYLRGRLKRFGVDLDNQGLNQDLARDALILDLATIDLKMASDTVSSSLVFELLPLDWALYLDRLRSKSYSLDDKFSKFEKFSSMGNGFTFELESLIFWALTKASMADETLPFAVYGDDIICPCSDAGVVISTLAYCGFTTNVDKTFVEGPFRESCGRHYFNGDDVTPIYQKETVDGLLPHLRFLNRLKRYAVKHATSDALDVLTNQVWKKEYLSISGQRPLIPCGTEGDNGYLVSHNDLLQPLKANRGHGLKFPTVVTKPVRIPAFEPAMLAYTLRLNHARQQRSSFNAEDGGYEALFRRSDLISVGKAAGRFRLSQDERDGYSGSYVSVYDGDIECMDDTKEIRLTTGSRWIEPSWEFALDSV